MGLTQKLGTIPLAIFTDASNNIGIGGSPSGSYKFEVTGGGAGVSTGDFYVDSANNAVYVGKQSSNSGDNTKFYVRNRINTLTALSVDPGGNGSVDVVGTFTATRGVKLATATGQVLIGSNTSTIGTALEVVGDIYASNKIYAVNGTAANPSIRFFAGASGLYSTTGDDLGITTNGTSRLYISSTGTATLSGTFVQSPSSGSGGFYIDRGTSTQSPYISWFNGSGTRLGYMGYSNTNVGLYLENSANFVVSGGNVLIGTTSAPSAYGLVAIRGTNQGLTIQDAVSNGYRSLYYQSGNLYFYNGTNEGYLSSGGTWVNASDVTLKKDVKEIEYGLKEVMELKPKWYRMIEDDLEQIGFIAQDVEEVLPELVSTSEKGMKGLSYGQLTAVLVKAIQELEVKVSALENKA